MSSDRRRLAEELFQQVADLPREQRAGYLRGRGEVEPAVRADVERLLARLDHGTVASLAAVERLDELNTDLVGERVGPYKLRQRIGEGGFGAVYMAGQEAPVRRDVALKIIKLGMDTKQVIARFEAERQALAMMDHPNIARVFDAGATEAGRPYFVMELVRGIPITEYCDENRVATRERLELFAQVCRAVQHAHQKGIIHRDIKPSNVLVTSHDGAPVPKVIDFGIAKATSERLTEKTLFTEFLQFIGTPQYMSPEQAAMSGLDVDTRTDVYSLGVLLYELLTGTTPFDGATLREAAVGEIQRIIQGEEPPTPSRRVSTLGARLSDVARARRAEPQTLRKLLRGELDWIVMKALEKDRTRRYETAASLADDVERHLNHEAVRAGPPSASYKLRKFVRRNRIAVVTASLMAVTVLLGLTAATIGFVRARAEARSAQAINAFFSEMLFSADPMQLRQLSVFAPTQAQPTTSAGGFARDVSVAEMVRGASGRIAETFEGKPELAAMAHETIGMTLRGLGRYAEAEPRLRAALEIRRGVLGAEHPDTLRSLAAVGDLLVELGRPHEAEPLLKSAHEALRRVHGDEHPKTLCCAAILAAALTDTGADEESEELFRETFEAQRRVLGAEHRDTLATMWKWSISCLLRQQQTQGQLLARDLYDISQRTLSPDDSLSILSSPLMGWWYVSRYQYDEAERFLRPGLVQCRRILGEDHPFTFMTMQCLARTVQGGDQQDYREQLCREALAGLLKTRGALHWQTISTTFDLARHLDRRGKYGEAKEVYRQLVDRTVRAFGEEDSYSLLNLRMYANFLERAGEFDESVAVRERRLETIRRASGSASVSAYEELASLARALVRIGRIDAARRVTRERIGIVRGLAEASAEEPLPLNAYAWALLTADPPDLRDPAAALPLAERAAELSEWRSAPILDTLALAQHLAGKNGEAVKTQLKSVALLPPESRGQVSYNASLVRYLLEQGDAAAVGRYVREGVAQFRSALGEDNPLLGVQLHETGVALAREGHPELAEALIREGLGLHRQLLGQEHEQVANCLAALADVLVAREQYEQAEQVCRAALELRRKLLGDAHLQVAETLRSLGLALRAGGDADGAVDNLRQALDTYRKLDAEAVPAAVEVKRELADALVTLRRIDEAGPLAREALDRTRALFGDRHARTVAGTTTLGLLLIEQGETREAEATLSRCLALCGDVPWPDGEAWRAAEVESALGHCLSMTNRFGEAETLLRRSYEALCAEKGSAFLATRTAARRLGVLFEAWGKPESAARWRVRSALHPDTPTSERATGLRGE